ncbi:hypothetical protein ACFFX0_20155 [Citricoccus parietis]|uniref:Uncharacterized protein n=1 Tax=Citricoccus parietis TaxID=592307 RepID=A0ABV5G363_9MICC
MFDPAMNVNSRWSCPSSTRALPASCTEVTPPCSSTRPSGRRCVSTFPPSASPVS